MLGVHLTEVKKRVDIIGVFDDVVLSLQRGILLASFKPDRVILPLDVKFLADREVLAHSWREY